VSEREPRDRAAEALGGEILTFLEGGPRHFVEVLERFRAHEYRTFLLAWSRLREQRRLGRDRVGRYVIVDPAAPSPRAATGLPT
jgi:hypothetical protein